MGSAVGVRPAIGHVAATLTELHTGEQLKWVPAVGAAIVQPQGRALDVELRISQATDPVPTGCQPVERRPDRMGSPPGAPDGPSVWDPSHG